MGDTNDILPSRCSAARHRARAFTLAEMIVSMAIIAMISAVCGSAMVFATRSIEGSYSSPGAAGAAARSANDWMSDDLKVATGFTEQTSTAVTMIVPDRTGDGTPDTVRYAWSGSAGSTIRIFTIPAYCVTREFNSGNPLVMVANAKTFSMTFDTRDVGPQSPKESSEIVLAWHEGASGTNEQLYGLTNANMVAQTVKGYLLHNAQTWKITKVRLKLQQSGGNVLVSLRATDAATGAPTGTSLGSVVINSSSIPATADWVTATFSTAITGLDVSKKYAVVVAQNSSGSVKSYVTQDNAASDTDQKYSVSTDGGSTWTGTTSASALQIYVYGTQTTQDPS